MDLNVFEERAEKRKKQAIAALCELRLEVAKEVFDFPSVACDCFCGDVAGWNNFQEDSRIFDFIKHATYRAIEQFKTGELAEKGLI